MAWELYIGTAQQGNKTKYCNPIQTIYVYFLAKTLFLYVIAAQVITRLYKIYLHNYAKVQNGI